jgi:alkanesulfonate monooxygenase SsuD/methylene tetrahydromethanopterin reductase-like flavin-dependent oxidoreductase (luciferase family)
MGSFALREPRVFAYEWASLDVISGGRTRLSVCSGGGAGPAWNAETEAMGIPADQRRKRMIENMAVLRHLWTRDNEPFEGDYVRFSGVALEPKPVQSPCPIWLTTNAGRLGNGKAEAGGSSFALRRVGRLADGWMTHTVTPDGFRASLDVILAAGKEAGRDMAAFDNVLCWLVNINEDQDAALADAKVYLDQYYSANYTRERLEAWGCYGSPAHCIEQLRRFRDCGVRRITFRLPTMGDAAAQFQRLVNDVLPYV